MAFTVEDFNVVEAAEVITSTGRVVSLCQTFRMSFVRGCILWWIQFTTKCGSRDDGRYDHVLIRLCMEEPKIY